MAQLAVADAGWLVHAVTGLQPHPALAFVVKLDPAPQHIDQLETGPVQVRLAAEVTAGTARITCATTPPSVAAWLPRSRYST